MDMRIMKLNLCVGLMVVALPFLGNAKDSGEDMVFLHYQNVIKIRDTGIYDDGDLLYVQVKLPFDRKRESIKQKKAQAVMVAYDLLKDWAIEYSSPERNKKDTSPAGVQFAKSIIVKYLPGWQFREWSPAFSIREFPHDEEDGYYIMGQSMAKADVIKCIPSSFFKPVANDDWNIALAKALKVGIGRIGRDSVVRICGAWDALPDRKSIVDSSEYVAYTNQIAKYLKSSPFVSDLRMSLARISGPNERETWAEVNGSLCSNENVIVSAVTNACKEVACSTNVVKRVQTKSEVSDIGRSCASIVEESCITADVEEIELKTTTTIVETKKIIRRRMQSRVFGNPMFEKMFVSGGSIHIDPVKNSPVGVAAGKVFFSSASLDDKLMSIIDALRENPADVKMWNYYGKCLQYKKDYVGAAICFRSALAIDKDYEFALVNLSETYQHLGFNKLALGMAIYARGVAKDPWCVSHSESVIKSCK